MKQMPFEAASLNRSGLQGSKTTPRNRPSSRIRLARRKDDLNRQIKNLLKLDFFLLLLPE